METNEQQYPGISGLYSGSNLSSRDPTCFFWCKSHESVII